MKTIKPCAYRLATAVDIRALYLIYTSAAAPLFVDIAGPNPGMDSRAFKTYCTKEAALYVERRDTELRSFMLFSYIQPELEMANLDFGFFFSDWAVSDADCATEFNSGLRAAFKTLGLTRVQTLVLADDGAKALFLERRGFKAEGCLREHFHFGHRQHDLRVFALTENRN